MLCEPGQPGHHHPRPPVIKALADALLTIGHHPLCSAVEVEQGDSDALAFFLDNGKTGDPAWPADLEATMADYDQIGPYRLTVILPLATETWDDEPGWETPSAAERNSSMLACA